MTFTYAQRAEIKRIVDHQIGELILWLSEILGSDPLDGDNVIDGEDSLPLENAH